MAISADVESSLRAKIEAVLPHLDERSARLVLAPEARSLRHGGAIWRGRPLTSQEVIVNSIAATRTRTGCTSRPSSTPASTPPGSSPDQQMRALETDGRINRHDWHG